MDKIKFEGSNWKVKLDERSRGRMKITIKLNKDESLGFKNWSDMVRPAEISDEEFLKQIFFNGIEHLNDKLQAMTRKILEDEQLVKDLESSGISVSSLSQSLPKQS